MKASRTVGALAILAALALVTALPALAAEQTYSIDSGHSTIGFRIRHLVSKVSGTFNKFSGEIKMDPANMTKGSVNLEIETASIDTRSERRNGHLRSPDFFAADSFPTITFKSTKVTQKGEDHLVVDGLLTMRGVTKPITLDVAFGGVLEDSKMGTRAGFDVTGKLDRKEFGIVWNGTLDKGGTVLGDDVELMIGIEAVEETPEPAGGKGEAKKG